MNLDPAKLNQEIGKLEAMVEYLRSIFSIEIGEGRDAAQCRQNGREEVARTALRMIGYKEPKDETV